MKIDDIRDKLKNVRVAERTNVGNFFTLKPADGLICPIYNKTQWSEGDIVFTLFNFNFGRDPIIGFWGGIENGINIKIDKLMTLTSENLKQLEKNPMIEDGELEYLVKRADIVVLYMSKIIEGYKSNWYFFCTSRGILTAIVNLSEVSKAEANFYHDLFASALPIGAKEETSIDQRQAKPTQQPANKKVEVKRDAEKEKLERVTQRYEEKCSSLQKAVDEACKKRDKIKEQQEKDPELQLLSEELQAKTKSLESTKSELASMSFIAFLKKKEANERIAQLEQDIVAIKNKIASTKSERKRTLQGAEDAVNKAQNELTEFRQQKDSKIKELMEDDTLELVFNIIVAYGPMTLSQIQQSNPVLSQMSNLRVAALVRELVSRNRIEKILEGRESYYQVNVSLLE